MGIIRTYCKVYKGVMKMRSGNVKLSFSLALFAYSAQFVAWFDHKNAWILISQTVINFLKASVNKAERVLNNNLLGSLCEPKLSYKDSR